MTFEPNLGDIAFALGGLLEVLLGLFVASLRPRRSANVAFAAFLVALGATDIAGSWRNALTSSDPLFEAAKWAFAASTVAGAAVLPALASRFPRPLVRRDLRLLGLPLALGVGFVAIGLATGLPTGRFAFSSGLSGLVGIGAFLVLMGETYFFCALLALRFRERGATGVERPMYAVACAALALGPGLQVGIWLAYSELQEFLWKGVAGAVAHGVLAVLWLRNAALLDGRASRVPRNVGLAILAAPLLTQVLWRRGPDGLPLASIGEFLAVLLLAYAILRHQLLGLDVKVRWTISKTTIAGTFVAVFFIASEAAQQFFGETLGSGYVGILAAGALVFAIAPLSRLADRIAERAVPAGPAAPAPDMDGAYRSALRAAMRDGSLSRREEHHLADLAGRLGISPKRALELREEVEAEHTRP